MLRFSPENPLYHLEEAHIHHFFTKNYELAIISYQKSLEIDPDNYEALVNLAIAYGRYHYDDDKAVDLLLKAIQINPKYVLAWVTLGDIFKYEYGDPDEAEVYYEQARILENLV